MGFFDHLEELRGTLIKSVIAFVIFAALIGYFVKGFNHALMWPLDQVRKSYPNEDLKLGMNSIMEGFSAIITVCVMGGLALASPFILFFIGQFVAPALTEKEKRAVLPLCASALILFSMGAAFGFFLLMPSTLLGSIYAGQVFEVAFRWTLGSYYSTLAWLVLGVGGTFEFPLVIILLVWLGILTTDFLRKYRRHAIVVIFIIAAVVTPSTDPFTLTVFAAPLYVLFEVAILVSARVEKRRALDRAA